LLLGKWVCVMETFYWALLSYLEKIGYDGANFEEQLSTCFL